MKNDSKPIPLIRGLLLIVLSLAVCIQVYLTANNYIRLWRMPIWRMRTETSFARSAVFHLKPRGAAFLKFIQSNVPPDGKIIIPPGLGAFSEQSILQFYLLDRDIFSCPRSTLAACLAEPDKYLIATADYPPQISVIEKNFIPYPDITEALPVEGIYIPLNQISGAFSPYYPEHYNIVFTIIIDVSILISWWLIGWLLLSTLIQNPKHPLSIFGAFPLGMGIFTWLLFIICLIGARLTIWTLLWTCIGILLPLFWLARDQVRLLSFPSITSLRRLTLIKINRTLILPCILVVVILFLSLSLVYISVGRGYSIFDDMAIWSLKGYYMAFKHDLFAAGEASGHGLAYPLNLSLAIASYFLIDQDLLPGSKLVYLSMFFSMLFCIYWFLRKQAVLLSLTLLMVLAIISTPVIFEYATLGFANIPFTSYLVIGTLTGFHAVTNRHISFLYASGLLLSLAGWTRPEGIGFVLSLALIVIWIGLRYNTNKIKLVCYLILSILFGGSWMLLGNQYLQRDEIGDTLSSLSTVFASNSFSWVPVWETFLYSLKQFATISSWGLIIPVSALILVILFPVMLRGKQALPFAMLGASLTMYLIPLGMLTAKYYANPANYLEFMSVSFARAQFPAITLFIIAAALIIGSIIPTPRMNHTE